MMIPFSVVSVLMSIYELTLTKCYIYKWKKKRGRNSFHACILLAGKRRADQRGAARSLHAVDGAAVGAR